MKLLALVGVPALVFLTPSWIGGPLFVVVFAYVCWRAVPAIRADLDRLPRLRGIRRAPGRYSADREGAL